MVLEQIDMIKKFWKIGLMESEKSLVDDVSSQHKTLYSFACGIPLAKLIQRVLQ